jgi:phosphatidylglycerol:prolipoprotein diacylglycerol transferase
MIPYFRPSALHFGPLSIQPWGIMVAGGFVTGSLLAQSIGRRRGLRPGEFVGLLGPLALGAAVFGHVGDALTSAPAHYIGRPWELLYVWNGLSSYEGFFGCAAIAIVYLRRRQLDVLRYCDVLVVGVACGWAIGRLGCFLIHDHIGRPLGTLPVWIRASLGWLAVSFPEGAAGAGVPAALRFDLGLVDSLTTWLVLVALLAMSRRPHRPGVLLGTGVVLYSAIRFASEFLRNVDLPRTDPRYFTLTTAQYGALIAIAVGLLAFRQGRCAIDS